MPPLVHEPVVSVHEVDAMLHTKDHEIREITTQLDSARVDVTTAALQLESANKQRDYWRAKYEADVEAIHSRHLKEREVVIAEKEGLQEEVSRLHKEQVMYQHELSKLQQDLVAEIAHSQSLEQTLQRAPSESVSYPQVFIET